jgi:hypothetical protein
MTGGLGRNQQLPVRDMARRPNKAVSSILIKWSRRAPRLNPTAGRGRMYIEIQLGQRAAFFTLLAKLGLRPPLSLWNPVAVDAAPGRGLRALGVLGGYGMLPALSETRTKADLP